MKFLRGFLMGAAVGFVAGTTLDDRRRRELAERASTVTRRQIKPVAETIGHEADRVAGVARARVESAVARAGDAAVDAIDDETGGTAATG
jgi:gas vesicle protein